MSFYRIESGTFEADLELAGNILPPEILSRIAKLRYRKRYEDPQNNQYY